MNMMNKYDEWIRWINMTNEYDENMINEYDECIWWMNMMNEYDEWVWWMNMMNEHDEWIRWMHMMNKYDEWWMNEYDEWTGVNLYKMKTKMTGRWKIQVEWKENKMKMKWK